MIMAATTPNMMIINPASDASAAILPSPNQNPSANPTVTLPHAPEPLPH